MKRMISSFLSAVILVAMCVPAIAADNSLNVNLQLGLERLEFIAYMDIDAVSEDMKEQILEARDAIIFNEAWVADGVRGYILDENGNVEEVVPQFSELFPVDWDMPEVVSQESAQEMDVDIPMVSTRSTWVDIWFNGSKSLSNPPTDTNSAAFCTGNTSGLVGTAYEYHYKTISTYGVYGNTSNEAYFNVGYANNSTGASLGWYPDIANGKSFAIDAPKNTTVAVRASTYSNVGSWVLNVTAYD